MKTSYRNRNRNPKVSVCIPCYNYGSYIGQCLESVLMQSFKDFEIIVVDNCSTDNTESVVKSFSDSRITYVRNRTNIGMVRNFNKAISLARGDYVSILHADDLYLLNILEAESGILDLNRDVGFVYSACKIIDANGKVKKIHQPFSADYIADRPTEFKKLLWGNHIRNPTVMVRREVYDKLGGYEEEFPYRFDYEKWLRISLYYDIAYISEPLACYRLHGQNLYTKMGLSGCAQNDIVNLIEKVFRQLPDHAKSLIYLKSKALARAYFWTACIDYGVDRIPQARQNVSLAISVDPSFPQDTEYILKVLVGHAFNFANISTQHRAVIQYIEKVFSNLPPAGKRLIHLRSKALARFHKNVAFESYALGHLGRVRKNAILAVFRDPSWLAKRRMVSIFLESLVGKRLINQFWKAKRCLEIFIAGSGL